MRLREIRVHNFRSFGNETSIKVEDLTALVGNNSSGKTSIMHALLRMFGDNSQDREIKRTDFHVPYNKNPGEITQSRLYIEAVIEFEEVEKVNGIDNYIIPVYYNAFALNKDTGIPYLRIRLDATWKRSNQPEGIIEQEMYFIISENKDFETTDKRAITKENLARIKVMYVPAVRNPHNQLKNVAGSILWRLLNGINMNQEFKQGINEELEKVNGKIGEHKGISTIKKFVESEWHNYHKDLRYQNVNFRYNTTDIDEILRKIEPQFTPTETGLNYSVDDIGDGLRSVFYLALVGTLLKAERETMEDIIKNPDKQKDERIFSMEPPCLTIVAVEEPENHVAPHLLGKVVSNLKDIAENSNAQVILSSHSTAIIKRVSATGVRHLRIDQERCTKVNEIILPPKEEHAYKYIKEAVEAYPEIYFSSLVILGEGDSEEVVLPKVFDVADIEINTHEIAIVPLGGRHVNHFWKLLYQLQIPHITLLDLDLGREGGGWGRVKYALEQLIANGIEKDKLLQLEDSRLVSDIQLGTMHLRAWNCNDEVKNIEFWIERLETYNVFFSNPLDLDFMMLEAFEESYKAVIGINGGPQVTIGEGDEKTTKQVKKLTEEELKSEEYKEKVVSSIKATLKNSARTGEEYNEEQHQKMIWYNYLFLYRGKPVMHRLALSHLSDEKFRTGMPQVFKHMIQKVKNELGIGEGEVHE